MSISKSLRVELIVLGLTSMLGLGLLIAKYRSEHAPKPFSIVGFQVMLPETVVASKEAKIDFDLIYFMLKAQQKRQILFAYVGNYPSFADRSPQGVKEQQSRIGGQPARTLEWKDKAGRLCRETLVKMAQDNFPVYAHFVYTGLTPAEARMSDSIIETVRPPDLESDSETE